MILHDILTKLKAEFCQSQKGQQRATWFIYTLVAIIIPFGSAKTSNLYRCLQTFFGLKAMTKKQYYRFMASPLIPWNKL